MEYYDYCAGCLVIGVKMYSLKSAITSTKSDKVFLNYLRIPSSSEKVHEANFCFECAALFRKFENFRSKCHRAQNVLSKLRREHYQITKKTLQNVNREEHGLISTISINHIECMTVNKHEDCSNTSLDTTNDPIPCDLTAKINSNINSIIDINIVKNEKQDTNESVFDDFHQVENTLTKHTFESASDDEPLSKKLSRTNDDLAVDRSKINIRKKFNINFFEDYATVIFLTPEEAKKELLLRKETSNYTNSPFKCEFCYRGYEAKTAFDNHMKKHSNDYGEFICDICKLRFPEQRCLSKHRLASHKRKFCCKLCPYVCFCTHQAKTHFSLHKGKKYPCTECGKIFSMPNSLLMHKRLKHQTECVCDLCGNTFATPRGLASHNMKVHRQDRNEKLGPKCEDCGLHFATEEAWKRHLVLSSKHNGKPPKCSRSSPKYWQLRRKSKINGCKNCGDTFSSAEELKRHMRIHARKHANRGNMVKLPATCIICDKLLNDKSEYKSHMKSAHPQSGIAKKLDAEESTPFVCELCGLAFKKQCFLKYHQRKHTGERPYKCAQCDKSYQLAGALATHRAVHLQRRGHACRVCGRGFTFKSALNKHMKVHLNIRPHRCDICEKSFISPCDVRLHVKYVHNKVPWPKRDRSKKAQETFAEY